MMIIGVDYHPAGPTHSMATRESLGICTAGITHNDLHDLVRFVHQTLARELVPIRPGLTLEPLFLHNPREFSFVRFR
jgi:hypothetical protein